MIFAFPTQAKAQCRVEDGGDVEVVSGLRADHGRGVGRGTVGSRIVASRAAVGTLAGKTNVSEELLPERDPLRVECLSGWNRRDRLVCCRGRTNTAGNEKCSGRDVRPQTTGKTHGQLN